jgi:hypothetical protein
VTAPLFIEYDVFTVVLAEIFYSRCEMLKNYIKTTGLFVAFALLLRRATKLLVTGAILANFGMAILPGSIRFTGTVNTNMDVSGFELLPLTGTVGYSLFPSRPMHDPGVTGSTSDPGVGSPSANPISYTVNGFIVVRRSELGPLTGTVNDPLLTHGPGHDFGVLGDEYKPGMSLLTLSPITYTVNGFKVVRRSELGPLN